MLFGFKVAIVTRPIEGLDDLRAECDTSFKDYATLRMCSVNVDPLLDERFQVLTATSMKMTSFWDTAPCSLVDVDRRFRGAYCLHHQGDK
jgi:hypothetical protein